MPKIVQYVISKYRLTNVYLRFDPETGDLLDIQAAVTRMRQDGMVHDNVQFPIDVHFTGARLNNLKQIIRQAFDDLKAAEQVK